MRLMSSRARKQASGSSQPAQRVSRGQESAASPGIRFRVDFRDRCSVGIGKIRLLEGIERSGSLSQAAREMGMSYRRAWLLIDSMNEEFDAPVVSATVGGSGGGGAKLTPLGNDLVVTYRALEARVAALTAEHMSSIAAHAVDRGRRSGSSDSPLRRRISRQLKAPIRRSPGPRGRPR